MANAALRDCPAAVADGFRNDFGTFREDNRRVAFGQSGRRNGCRAVVASAVAPATSIATSKSRPVTHRVIGMARPSSCFLSA